MDEGTVQQLAAAVADVVTERGAVPWAEVRDALVAAGHESVPEELPLDLEDELVERRIGAHGSEQLLAPWALVVGGAWATRRVTADELASGGLRVEPDLALVLHTVAGIELTGPGGVELRREWDDGGELITGPPGWLGELDAGDLVGVQLVEREVRVQRVDAEPDGDLVQRLADAFADDPMPDGTSDAGAVAAYVAARDPGAFSVPRRPLGELLAEAGLVLEGSLVGPPGHDWPAFWEERRIEYGGDLAATYGLDELDGRLMADLVTQSVRFGGESLTDEEWERVAVALASPAATEAFTTAHDGRLGLFGNDSSVADLRRFAGAVLERASSPRPPAGALVALARCAEFDGDLLAAEELTRQALQSDDDFGPALADLGWYTALRGQPARAAALLRRSGSGEAEFAEVLDLFAQPGPMTAGRNDPCPCGSGQKHKRCCGPTNGHDLASRAILLHHKAVAFADRPAGRQARLPLAAAAAGVGVDDDGDLFAAVVGDDNDRVFAALFDIDTMAIQVFDGGGNERFLAAAGPLLPADEAELLARWVDERHRVWEVVEPPAGPALRLRDPERDVEVTVPSPGARWSAGQEVLAAVVPLDGAGTVGLLGAVLGLTDEQAKAAAAAVASGSAGALAAAAVGPALAAAIAARTALWESAEEVEARLEWLFPGEGLTVADVEDEDVMWDVLDRWAFTLDVEGLDDEEVDAAPLIDSLLAQAVEQLLRGDPPEAWEAATRLAAEGATPHEVVREIVFAMVEQLDDMADGAPYDQARYLAQLRQLGVSGGAT